MAAYPVFQHGNLFSMILSFSVLLVCLRVTSCYEPMQIEIPQDGRTIRFFSDDDIAAFDGSDPDSPVYMAVKGVVFDVSSGKDFYGKGAPYNALAGKDCSRAVAKMSLDPADLTSDITGLTDGYLKALDDVYKGTYLTKYPIVGYMESMLTDKERKLLYDEL